MMETAKNELENTKQARHIFMKSPWFDLSLRVDGRYPSSLRMIDVKIAIMEEELSKSMEGIQ